MTAAAPIDFQGGGVPLLSSLGNGQGCDASQILECGAESGGLPPLQLLQGQGPAQLGNAAAAAEALKGARLSVAHRSVGRAVQRAAAVAQFPG